MNKLSTMAFIFAFFAGTAAYAQNGSDSSNWGSTDTKKGSTGATMDTSTGTTGGKTGGAMDISGFKKDMENRLDKIDREINDLKKSTKNMPQDQKQTMNQNVKSLQQKRNDIKKSVSALKDTSTADERAKIETDINDLEQQVRSMSSGSQRSTPAGDSNYSGSDNTTGGSMMDKSTETKKMGGTTGGAVMRFSYDQRDQFTKTMKIRLDTFNKRIDLLKENARKSPQGVNEPLSKKVDGLYAMSGKAKDELDKVKSSNRADWDATKSNIEKDMNKLEESLTEAEKMVK